MVKTPSPKKKKPVKSRILSIDVRITYCHTNGKQRVMVIDTTKVKGITWDPGAHASKLPGVVDKDPKNRLRRKGKPDEFGACPKVKLQVPKEKLQVPKEEPQVTVEGLQVRTSYALSAGATEPSGDSVCCWWDGTQWICPDEVE